MQPEWRSDGEPRKTRPPGLSTPERAAQGTPGMTANNLRSSPIERRRLATLSGESCEDCRKQLHQDRDALPHPRLMIVSATPVVESFGGGVETRYICLDCGYTITR